MVEVGYMSVYEWKSLWCIWWITKACVSVCIIWDESLSIPESVLGVDEMQDLVSGAYTCLEYLPVSVYCTRLSQLLKRVERV